MSELSDYGGEFRRVRVRHLPLPDDCDYIEAGRRRCEGCGEPLEVGHIGIANWRHQAWHLVPCFLDLVNQEV